MGINSPLPAELGKEMQKACKIVEKFVKIGRGSGPDQLIPPNIIANAKGVAILSVIKAGFLFSGRAGSGIVVARLPDGGWSAPSGINTAGMGVGGQIGAELTDFVIILNTDDAVRAFSHGGNVTLGGNLSVAMGPVGRSAEASGTVGNLAAVYSYSKTKGLFAGISIEGSAIIERKDANEAFYGKKVSAKELLSGKIPAPAIADPLYDALDKRSNMPSSNAYASGERLDQMESRDSNNSARNSSSRLENSTLERRNSASGNSSDPLSRPTSIKPQVPIPVNSVSRYTSDSVSRSDTFKPQVLTPGNTANIRPPGNPFGEYKPPVAKAAPPIPNRISRQENVVALYDFNGEQAGDLSFRKGDIIIVVKKDGDWWSGSCKGKKGIFPSNYVQMS